MLTLRIIQEKALLSYQKKSTVKGSSWGIFWGKEREQWRKVNAALSSSACYLVWAPCCSKHVFSSFTQISFNSKLLLSHLSTVSCIKAWNHQPKVIAEIISGKNIDTTSPLQSATCPDAFLPSFWSNYQSPFFASCDTYIDLWTCLIACFHCWM